MMDIEYFIWYNIAEKGIYDEIKDLFNKFAVDGHILEHNLKSFSAFISKYGRKFFVNPETCYLQLDNIDELILDKYGEVRPSWGKLLSYYGECIKSCVLEKKRRLMLHDFYNSSGNLDGEKMRDLSLHVIEYQRNRVNDALGALQRFLPKEAKVTPVFLTAPYFYVGDINDGWYNLSLRAAKEATSYKGDFKLFAVICIAKSLLADDKVISQIAEDYTKGPFDGFLLLINDFSEDMEDEMILKGFIKLVESLAKARKPIINLYGGYFSALLHHRGLSGFVSGLTYGFSTDIAMPPPKGGPPGGPVAKYYIPWIHQSLTLDEALRILREVGQSRCSCPICSSLKSSFFNLDPKSADAKYFSKMHFLYSRYAELQDILKKDYNSLRQDILQMYKQFKKFEPLIDVEYLNRWYRVL
jgi:hypothetical protein